LSNTSKTQKIKPPLVLLSNDDGFNTPGITILQKTFLKFCQVVIVAPHEQRSGTSHSITLDKPLRIHQVKKDVFSVTGTPVDCIYIAVYKILKQRPDLIVVGINHGLNLGTDIFYSGTVSAAREGALRGIPSMAISMDRTKDITEVAEFTAKLGKILLNHRLPKGVFLNINIPKKGIKKGIQITRPGFRIYRNNVIERHDPRGWKYYWIGGEAPKNKEIKGTDGEAINNDFVSISPLSIEQNILKEIKWLKKILGSTSLFNET
jgi:5'-nucleotidase